MNPCDNKTDFAIDGCKDFVTINTTDVKLQDLGRIVQVNVPIKNVCPGKQVAVAVILTEVDVEGKEYQRGIKTILVPAQPGETCKDIMLKCINFILPESLDVTGDKESICNIRTFKVMVIAHYVDTDFICCK